MDNKLSFDLLPKAINSISERLNKIEALLIHQEKNISTSSHTDIFLNIHQASEYMSLAVQTIYSKCSQNSIPHIKKGGRLYFIESDLYKYIKSGRKKTIEEIQEEANSFLNHYNKKG